VPKLGILEWFRAGDEARVEAVLRDLRDLGIQELRTGVSWAEWHKPEGRRWFEWLLPRLASEVSVLPCVLYTPPSIALAPRSAAPPKNPKHYADFIDVLISGFGDCFEYIEFWNEPNNLSEYDWTLDPQWLRFCEMVGGAAYWSKQRGKKTVLGGMSPADPNWLSLMFERGLMQHIDAVGLHGFPGAWETAWEGWEANVAKLQAVLDAHGSGAEIWITEAGYSTWRNDEYGQLRAFHDAKKAPAARLYWYGAYDLDPMVPTVDGFHSDEREYHFGLKRADGTPKLLYRIWKTGGLKAVAETAQLPHGLRRPRRAKAALITGGAGFIGTNVADRLLSSGKPVVLLDNLSRAGVETNLRWLLQHHSQNLEIEIADIRDPFALKRALANVDQVFHFAAQVAVTTSLDAPIHDFDVNARGTLNLLEEIRALPEPPSLLFTSTNKVYGALDDIEMVVKGDRYEPKDLVTKTAGIGEDRPLDFHSPYGCSKGAADQYVIDYARTFGIPAVVFRMSCIYGPHQFGTEDQGWVAHFMIKALQGEAITLYGDGKQVRDVLFVEDLVEAMLLAQQKAEQLSGQAFNIGGGPGNAISLLELVARIEDLGARKVPVRFEGWRPGDQRYYVSDTTRFAQATGWRARFDVARGVDELYQWLAGARRASKPLAAARSRGRVA
ncbi:MAG TPA: GDP-mannose 4,6-dehydratase, partial [Fimbriimonadaceae bacterium]|nr:GDP-mannose 4,6-dehydratase [Fimbriimonadaceae bacterium]